MTSAKYAGQHRAIRRAMLPYAVGSKCTRCLRVILPGQVVHLDHEDDGVGYRGWSHKRCNESAGGKLGAARKRAARNATREKVKRMTQECVLGIEISEDRQHTAIVAASRIGQETVLVDLVGYLDGSEAVPDVLRLRGDRTVHAVCIDPHSAAATLIKPLTEAGVDVTQLSTSDVVVAHGMFLDTITAGRLRHSGAPQLDAAVRHAMTRPVGGATAWQRRGLQVDPSPLTAATWAVWGLLGRPAPQPFFAAWRSGPPVRQVTVPGGYFPQAAA